MRVARVFTRHYVPFPGRYFTAFSGRGYHSLGLFWIRRTIRLMQDETQISLAGETNND